MTLRYSNLKGLQFIKNFLKEPKRTEPTTDESAKTYPNDTQESKYKIGELPDCYEVLETSHRTGESRQWTGITIKSWITKIL